MKIVKSFYTRKESNFMADKTWAWVVIRLPPEEKRLLQTRAREYHLNLSRFLVLMGLRGEVK